jgi:hypothetical protein
MGTRRTPSTAATPDAPSTSRHDEATIATEPPIELPPPAVVARARRWRERIDPAMLHGDLVALPGPRSPVEQPEASAATVALLEQRFQQAGWSTTRQPFEVRDTARHYGRLLARYFPDAPGVNVVAQRVGTRRPDDLVVVGAHHDTLPTTPGADDNGAGLVALLELARLLSDVDLDATVALVAFDHEEIGFHGARHYVWQLPPTVTLRGALIYETMAYVRHEPDTQRLPPGFGALFPRQVRHVRRRGRIGDFDAVIYRNRSQVVARRLAGALAALEGQEAAMLLRDPVDLPIAGTLMKYLLPPVRNLARSDHVPFWDAGLPAVQVTDTANFRNPHYHQPSDHPDTLDLDRLAAIVAATAVTVERTAGSSEDRP